MTIPAAGEIQRFTEQVLAGPEFHVSSNAPAAVPPWVKGLAAWLALHPFDFLSSLSLGTILACLLGGCVLVALTVYLVRLVLREGRRPGRSRPGRKRAAEGPVDARHLQGPRELVLEAARALAAGDSRRAIQELLRAGISLLAGRGLISVERWKTNSAYVRECPPGGREYSVLRELTSVYDEVVFAHREVRTDIIAGLLAELSEQVGPA